MCEFDTEVHSDVKSWCRPKSKANCWTRRSVKRSHLRRGKKDLISAKLIRVKSAVVGRLPVPSARPCALSRRTVSHYSAAP